MQVSSTCYHEALQSQVGCGRNINLLTATAEEVLLLTTPVHGGYAELATSAEEIKRPSQLLQHRQTVSQGRAGQGRAGQGRAGQGRAGQGICEQNHNLCSLNDA